MLHFNTVFKFILTLALLWCRPAFAGLIDSWRASDLRALNQGESVSIWTSQGSRTAAAAKGDEPKFLADATPSGSPAIAFQKNRLISASSPIGGMTQFSIAVVMKAGEAGIREEANWFGKSGVVDASEAGTANDWGLSLRESGVMCFGTGNPDATAYSDNNPSIVDGNYHVILGTWGGGVERIHVDSLPSKTQTGVSTLPRSNAGISFGAIHTGEINRRFAGEIAEIRFYDTALTPAESASVINELSQQYLVDRRPTIQWFNASTNRIYLGKSLELSWKVENAALVSVDHGVGEFSASAGAALVSPRISTTYTLTASNSFGFRKQQVSISVESDTPIAYGQQCFAIQNQPLAIQLAGWDPASHPLVFAIASQPAHGTLDGTGGALVYIPGKDFLGRDVFTFKASDGENESLPASISIQVRTEQETSGPSISSPLVINEIHYNPPTNTVNEEFIEIYNNTDQFWDLSGWQLSGGISYVFAPGSSIQPHGFAVVAANPAILLSLYNVQAYGPWKGGLKSEGEKVALKDFAGKTANEVNYRSEFPWPIACNGGGPSMELIHPELNNDLGSSWAAPLRTGKPSPGKTNAVYAANPAPNIRQVAHQPKMPASTNEVLITAKVTDRDGVGSVRLFCQIVPAGNFIPSYIPLTPSELISTPFKVAKPNPAYTAAANWIEIPMHDDGLDGDAIAGDDVFSARLPRQGNRTLVRYKITVSDLAGASRTAPFEDDESLNFAYFVYDGVPAYAGISSADLSSLPVYFLLTRSSDFDQCIAYNSAWQIPQFNGGVANEGRYVFNWPGAFVYEGDVYDHIQYRLRGANGRYQAGKRSFRFKFRDGRHFAARDMDGKAYPRKWASLDTAKGQSNRQTLNFSLNEAMNYYLFNKAGVPAPNSHFFHWRVVRGAAEAPDAYNGDFYGLNWAQEDYDVNFLESHGMEKGNLYKLINAARSTDPFTDMLKQQRYQAPFAVTNGHDGIAIQSNLANGGPNWTDSVLMANANYPLWYRYSAINEAIRNYDTWPYANKNAAWYFEPYYAPENGYMGRLWLLPWDTTDTWGPTWNSGQDLLWSGLYAGAYTRNHLEMQKQHRNAVREIRDLLIQPDQINPIIDAFAARISSVVVADLARWSDCTPAGSSYRSMGNAGPALSQGLKGLVQDMKSFLFTGGSHAWWADRETIGAGGWSTRLDSMARDTNIPSTPSVVYTGPQGYPIDQLSFESTAYADPQGASTFAAMQWRLAEVSDPAFLTANPLAWPVLEWDAIWESGTISNFDRQISIPGSYLSVGKLYRLRTRHADNTGCWSTWSAPVEFRAGAADLADSFRRTLVVSEIDYHPVPMGAYSSEDLEFLELANIGTNSLNLSGLEFTSGIHYSFPNGAMLAPGSTFLLARNPDALEAAFPGVKPQGAYTGKLDNAGETIALSMASGDLIFEFAYGTQPPWPSIADGGGCSLNRRVVPGDPNNAIFWEALPSSPGRFDFASALDSDEDGMPDSWEKAMNTNPAEPDAASDPDSDGLSNLSEFIAGTDPRNPASRLRIESVRTVSTGAELLFEAVSNRCYNVEASPIVHPLQWFLYLSVPNSVTNRIVSVPLSPGTNLFYRLEIPTK